MTFLRKYKFLRILCERGGDCAVICVICNRPVDITEYFLIISKLFPAPQLSVCTARMPSQRTRLQNINICPNLYHFYVVLSLKLCWRGLLVP